MNHVRRSAAFAVTAVLTLAVAMGLVIAVVSLYSSVVLNPVTVPEPSRVVSLYAETAADSPGSPSLSWPRFQFIRSHPGVLARVGAYTSESVTVGAPSSAPEPVRGLRVSGDFFEVLSAVPAQGRLLASRDDEPNGPRVCVLSYDFWQSRFGGAHIVGETVTVNGQTTEVVGVLGRALSPPWADHQLALPRVVDDAGFTAQAIANGASFLGVVGRLRPAATYDQAALEARRLSDAYSSGHRGLSDAARRIAVRPLAETVVGANQAVFRALLGAVCLVLTVAGANVSSLFLGSLISRQRELAIRQALGASRARLVAQLMGESFSVAAIAGALGGVLAVALVTASRPLLASHLTPGLRVSVDLVALAGAVAAVLFSAVLVGLIPALHVTRPTGTARIAAAERGLSESRSTRRVRSILVVAETALAVMLLVATALLVKSLARLQGRDPGFVPGAVAAGFVNLPIAQYDTPARRLAFFYAVLDRLRAHPEVSSAAVVFGLPYHDEPFIHPFAVRGRPIPAPADRLRAGTNVVTEDYFGVMRIPLVRGRFFRAEDDAGKPGVCILNVSLARKLFGTEDALGQVILRGREAEIAHEVVGVVADVLTEDLRGDAPDEIYYPFRQAPRPSAAIVARSKRDPAALFSALTGALAAVDGAQPLARFATMESRVRDSTRVDRLIAGVISAFGLLGLFLSSLGLYAVVAHGVSARVTEIGVRLALGARPSQIAALVIGQGLGMVLLGIAAGSCGALALSRVLAAQLYAVTPSDPLSYVVVASALAIAGVLSSLVPAARAVRMDPVAALRG
jgi:predicted permease